MFFKIGVAFLKTSQISQENITNIYKEEYPVHISKLISKILLNLQEKF